MSCARPAASKQVPISVTCHPFGASKTCHGIALAAGRSAEPRWGALPALASCLGIAASTGTGREPRLGKVGGFRCACPRFVALVGAYRSFTKNTAIARNRDFKGVFGRGTRIRTADLQYPKLPRYQAALYPDPAHGRYTLKASTASHRSGAHRIAAKRPGAAGNCLAPCDISGKTARASRLLDGFRRPSCPWHRVRTSPAHIDPGAARSCRTGAGSPCGQRCPASPHPW